MTSWRPGGGQRLRATDRTAADERFEEQLVAGLHRLARTIPCLEEDAADVVRRARARRTRRRVGVVACAAALFALLGMARLSALGGGPEDHPDRVLVPAAAGDGSVPATTPTVPLPLNRGVNTPRPPTAVQAVELGESNRFLSPATLLLQAESPAGTVYVGLDGQGEWCIRFLSVYIPGQAAQPIGSCFPDEALRTGFVWAASFQPMNHSTGQFVTLVPVPAERRADVTEVVVEFDDHVSPPGQLLGWVEGAGYAVYVDDPALIGRTAAGTMVATGPGGEVTRHGMVRP